MSRFRYLYFCTEHRLDELIRYGYMQCSGSVSVPSGSVSQRYGSGSVHHQAKIVGKPLISTVFVISL
jgi:hypothetical protein